MDYVSTVTTNLIEALKTKTEKLNVKEYENSKRFFATIPLDSFYSAITALPADLKSVADLVADKDLIKRASVKV